jgi:drug/metabolite transporter (DMT)-like permease
MNSPIALFAIATLIWGSTWLAITFQLGVVEPEVSVVYRFALAAFILFVWCAARGQRLQFEPRTHAWLALQGSTLFGLNYVGVYVAERYVASGLVAVAFSTLVFIVPIFSRLALRNRRAGVRVRARFNRHRSHR